MASSPQPQTSPRTRLAFVDGLRGFAAMSVVVCHFYGNLRAELSTWMPEFARILAAHGSQGVTIFFVLSGLVITLNVGTGNVRGLFLLRFALRRSIRLDPPYWLAIATAVAMMWLAEFMFSDIQKIYPTPRQIAAHLLYLQDILGFGGIVAVFWTLCLEVQFYLFIVLILLTGQLLTAHSTSVHFLKSTAFQFVWLLLIAVSMLDFVNVLPLDARGLFIPYWYCFGLGATVTWTLAYRMPVGVLLAAHLIVASGLLADVHQLTLLVALATSVILFVAGSRDGMSKWLSSSLAQFLGRISYSLYLFHAIVGWSSISLFRRLWPGQLGLLGSATAFLFGIAVSIAVSWTVYRLIERPSIALSRKVTLRQ